MVCDFLYDIVCEFNKVTLTGALNIIYLSLKRIIIIAVVVFKKNLKKVFKNTVLTN